jgi:hypothetical protein
MFMLVLIEAWEYCITKHDKEDLISLVEDYINTGIFGTAESKSQWKLPLTQEFHSNSELFSLVC